MIFDACRVRTKVRTKAVCPTMDLLATTVRILMRTLLARKRAFGGSMSRNRKRSNLLGLKTKPIKKKRDEQACWQCEPLAGDRGHEGRYANHR